jgi:hypothetical protein
MDDEPSEDAKIASAYIAGIRAVRAGIPTPLNYISEYHGRDAEWTAYMSGWRDEMVRRWTGPMRTRRGLA